MRMVVTFLQSNGMPSTPSTVRSNHSGGGKELQLPLLCAAITAKGVAVADKLCRMFPGYLVGVRTPDHSGSALPISARVFRLPSNGNQLMGIPSPPSWVPTGGFHHPYFVHMFYLAYITTSLLARSKSVTTKMFEIKSEKNTRPCRMSIAADLAKRGVKRVRIE